MNNFPQNNSAMDSTKEFTKVKAAEQNLTITEIQAIFEKTNTNIQFSEGQDIVAFVGPTKAGKSTLINCLMGNWLISKMDPGTEDTHIVNATDGEGPIIGGMGESETSIPKAYSNLPGTNWPMWDFPGFGDNKGTQQEIANAAAYERVLRPQRSVKFVLVVPNDLIKSDNPMQFYKLLNEIVLICPKASESIGIVVTKSEKGSVNARLKNLLSGSFSNASKENTKVVNAAKRVIQNLMDNNRFIDFKAPVMGGDALEESFTPPNLKDIVNLIRNLKGTSVSDFPLVISDQAKHEILELYTGLYQKLKREIEQVCEDLENFSQRNIEGILGALSEGKPINSSTQLEFFRQGQNAIKKVIENGRDLKKIFNELKENAIPVQTQTESIENFLFIEKIQNMYKTKEKRVIQGEKEFYARIMVTMNLIAQKYSDLIISSAAATDNEKRLENAWKEAKEKENRELKSQLRELEKFNESYLVAGAKYLASLDFVKTLEQKVCTIQ